MAERSDATAPRTRALGQTAGRLVGRAGTTAEGRELRARGQRTMRKLLDAGIEVFGKLGYHPARVDDIVKVAKTSHGTFYLYFANKEDLFRALAVDVAEEMRALAQSLGPVGPDDAGHAELRAWLARFVEMHQRYGPVIRAWTEAEIDASDFGRLGADVLADFAGTLTEQLGRSVPADLSPDIAALALVAMIERFSYYVYSGQVDAAPQVLIDTLADLAWAAMFGAREGASH